MADTLVETLVALGTETINGNWGPYWSDASIAVIIFTDNGNDISFARTTDKGATWNTTQITGGTVVSVAAWYDKETPGNAGTLIHLAWLDQGTNTAYYITIDVADASLGTQRTVDSTLTVAGFNTIRVAITQTVSGNIIYALSTQVEIECYKSADNFATAGTDIADVFETGTEEDWCLLFPADTDDGDDACALFWDRSATEISLKVYDDSGDAWTEKSISGGMVGEQNTIEMDGSVRHSDSHILIAAHSDPDSAGDDLMTWDLTVDDPNAANCTVTAKTNIFTDQAEAAQVAVFINQNNDDVYVSYLKGGTWAATVDVVFHKSVNGMGAWGSEQAYSENVADDFRRVQAGRTVGAAGGRYQPAWFDDDDADIFINETNDIEIAAVAALTVGEMMAARMMGPAMTPPVPAEVVAY